MRTVIRIVLGAMLVAKGGSAATAGTVRIEPGTGPGNGRNLTVVAEGATLFAVMAKLSETYGFRLDYKGLKTGDAARGGLSGVNGRFEGPLRTVVDRLLANESYFIEHTAQSKSGLVRVVVYNVGSTGLPGMSPSRVAPVNNELPNLASPTAGGRSQQTVPAVPALVLPVRRVHPAVLARPTAGATTPLISPPR